MGKQRTMTLEDLIEEKVGELRTETVDFSFGEIISLSRSTPREFEIAGGFQRFFRWSEQQQSRLIESILLALPIPQIFVLEGATGVIELIDGLQRISSVMHFIEPRLLAPPNNEPLRLVGCGIIPDLNGLTYEELSFALRLRIKRSAVRAVVIRRQSTPTLRYSMFKRLKSGGSVLSPQEVRTCTSRMAGELGGSFSEFLRQQAAQADFRVCIETLSQSEIDQTQDEELVLRFLALKNAPELFSGTVRDWLDDYMEAMIFQKMDFQARDEERDFARLFRYLHSVLGNGAFVNYRNDQPIGGLIPEYFEAVSMGTWKALPRIEERTDRGKVRLKLIETLQSEEFRALVGPGSNSRAKLSGRVEIIQQALMRLVP